MTMYHVQASSEEHRRRIVGIKEAEEGEGEEEEEEEEEGQTIEGEPMAIEDELTEGSRGHEQPYRNMIYCEIHVPLCMCNARLVRHCCRCMQQ